ncbi:MAG: hypothetical protein ACW967_00440 [Candidatus Hodarchaeales archaeon]|jgi:hypothetical protein
MIDKINLSLYLERIGLVYLLSIVITLINLTPLYYIPEGGPGEYVRDTAPYHTGLYFIAPVLLTYGILFIKLSALHKPVGRKNIVLPIILTVILPIFVQTGMLIREINWYDQRKATLLMFNMLTTLILLLIIPIIDYIKMKKQLNTDKIAKFTQDRIIFFIIILIILSIIEIMITINISLTIANECCSPPHSIVTNNIQQIFLFIVLSFIMGLYWGPYYPLGEYLLIYILMIGVIIIYISFYSYVALKKKNKEK